MTATAKWFIIGLISFVINISDIMCNGGKQSKNSILQFNPQLEPVIDPDSICKEFKLLTPHQQSICQRYPHATASAMQGVKLAIHECKRQFAGHRWNCSNLDDSITNSHPLMQRGYKETAFAQAVTAAGVVHQVATSCALGKITSCGCEGGKNPADLEFDWNGCSHDLGFGAKYSRRFLRRKENQESIQMMIQAHNSRIGRKAVIDQKSTKCKCHGMSSSCEIKTCWLAAPDLQIVGDKLKGLYERSAQVDRTNSVKGVMIETSKKRIQTNSIKSKEPEPRKNKKAMRKQLVYYEPSPTFCLKNGELGTEGTSGRVCNNTVKGANSCSSLCCGRGFFTVRVHRVEKCNCKFHWCCYVVCDKCEFKEWVTVCK